MLLRRGRSHFEIMISQDRSDSKQVYGIIALEIAEERCRILPAGGLGVTPRFKNPPRLGDIGG